MNKTTDLAVISTQIDGVLKEFLTSTADGVTKAYQQAAAIEAIEQLMTPEYMKPILALQNKAIGFKTDRKEGYPEHIVKKCVIEALFYGVEVIGNQFNIIAENTYLTKEGFGHLLKKQSSNLGLEAYSIVPLEVPQVKEGHLITNVEMKMLWTIKGEQKELTKLYGIKTNRAMGTDAVIGKAERKARKDIYEAITGIEIPEGDVADAGEKIHIQHKDINQEEERLKTVLASCKTLSELAKLKPSIKTEEQKLLYNARYVDLTIETASTMEELEKISNMQLSSEQKERYTAKGNQIIDSGIA